MFFLILLLLVQVFATSNRANVITRQVSQNYQLSSPRVNVLGVGSASTRVGNTIYIVGGSGDESAGPAGTFTFVLRDNRQFIIASQSWKTLSPLPISQQRAYHSLDFVGGDSLLAFGGSDGTNYLNDLLIYSIATNLWSSVGLTNSPPTPRAGHASFILNDDLWIFGGITTSRVLLNDVWRFSRSSSTWTQVSVSGNGPPPRYLHHAFQGTDTNVICLFGGSDSPNDALVFSNSASNSVYCMDTATSQWRAPLTSPGNIPSSFAYVPFQESSSGFSVIGGVAGSAVSANAYSFNYASSSWTTTTLATPVAYASGQAVQGFLWHFGGLQQSGELQTRVMAIGPEGVWGQVSVGCEPGYTGANCTVPLCRNNCWNLGRCIAPDLCECIEGFTGALCEQQTCTTCGINQLSLNQEIYWPRAKQKAERCIERLTNIILQIQALLPPFPVTCAQTYRYTYPYNLTDISRESWQFLQTSIQPLVQTTQQTIEFLSP